MKGFKQGTVLLVTPQVSQRSGLRKTLLDLGIDNKLIEIAGDFEQAKARLEKSPVNLIITEDVIGAHTGMELLDLHIRNNPVSKERLFLIMLSESSPFFLADFSLKGGDIIINKPFTNETFLNTLTTSMTAKEKLSPDECLSLDIQDAIKMEDLDKGAELLLKFKNPESIHALYSAGILHEARKEYEPAYVALANAIRINPDFKSLVTLVRIGKVLQKHFEMLEFVDIWVKKFPLHHDSIQDIARIIIANKKFDLLDELFALFAKHKVNDNFAKIPIAAGFVMASNYHFENNELEKTKEYALKALEYSCKKTPVIIKALDMLMRAGAYKDAEKAYEKLALPTISPEDKVIDIRLKNIIYPKNIVLVDCVKLLSQKVVDPDLYKITISCLKHIGKDPQEILSQAKRAFPAMTFETD